MTAQRLFWTLSAAFLLTVAGCGADSSTSHSEIRETVATDISESEAQPAEENIEEAGESAIPGELVGRWTLIAIDGAPVPEAGKTPGLEFFDDGSVTGVSGINQIRSDVTFVEGQLSFGPTAGTKMAGSPAAMELESTFLDRLGAVSTFVLEGETLHFWAGDNEALTFARTTE